MHALTYMSILHLHKSCCLLVYPWGRPSQSGAVVPHRAESPVDNSCCLKEQNQGSVVCVCVNAGEKCGRLKEQGYENPKTHLSARTEWVAPLHHRSPGQSVLSCIHATLSKTIHFPQGSWLSFLRSQAVTVHVNDVSLSSSKKQAYVLKYIMFFVPYFWADKNFLYGGSLLTFKVFYVTKC